MCPWNLIFSKYVFSSFICRQIFLSPIQIKWFSQRKPLNITPFYTATLVSKKLILSTRPLQSCLVTASIICMYLEEDEAASSTWGIRPAGRQIITDHILIPDMLTFLEQLSHQAQGEISKVISFLDRKFTCLVGCELIVFIDCTM